jgi:hypothetical protein
MPTGKVLPMDELLPVVLMKHAVDQRYEPQETPLVNVRTLKTDALLQDWRERFRDTPMWTKRKPTAKLEEVQDVADDDSLSQDEEMRDARVLLEAAKRNGDLDEESEDEDDEDEPMDLDPEALKMAIQQNLAAAGVNVNGMDEETLMRFAMKMFTGEGEAGDVVGEFADQLLSGRNGDTAEDIEEEDAQTEDEEHGFAGWVQKQAEEKASKKEREKRDLPTPTDSQGKPSASPPEKRPEKDVTATESSKLSDRLRGTKRKADSAAHLDEPKRSARRFDAPTVATKARSVSGRTTATHKGRKG